MTMHYDDDDWYPAQPTVSDPAPPRRGRPRKDGEGLGGFANRAGKLTERQRRLLAEMSRTPGKWRDTKSLVLASGYEHKRGNGWSNTFHILKHNLRTQPQHGWRLEKKRGKRATANGGAHPVTLWRLLPNEEGGAA